MNVENTLARFVQPRLYPLDLTELKADCRHHYNVSTSVGPVRVTGYGLAEAAGVVLAVVVVRAIRAKAEVWDSSELRFSD